MPAFEPPLGTTTLIAIPQSDKPRFAHLTFQLSFARDEDDSGSWEIWTDLALVREDGERVHGDGAWHSMKFERVEEAKEDEGEERGGSTDGLRLQATSPRSADEYKTRCFQARGVILAQPGSSWSYTFRRVFPSEDVHWLGQDGGNGVIKVEISEEAQSSSTPRTVEDCKGDLQGIAIELSNSDSHPLIHVLPSTSHITADIIILTKTVPLSIPFYIIAYDPHRPQIKMPQPVHSVSIAPLDQHYEIESRSFHPEGAVQPVSYAESVAVACESAVRKANAGTRITIATVSGAAASDVLAFYLISGAESEPDAVTTHLIIYASACPIDRLVWIAQPGGKNSSVPLVVVDVSGQNMLFKNQGQDEGLPALLPPGGTVAQVLGIQPFHQLRGTGDSDSMWICVPGATSLEVGEEEIDSEPFASHRGHGIANAGPIIEAQEPTPEATDKVQVDVEEASIHTDSTPELEESILSHDDHNRDHEPKEPALWILKLVGRFLINLFHAVLSTFGFGPKLIEPSPRAGASEADETEAGARTPVDVDERTPLLQSEMSRSTTASGPLSDVLASFTDALAPIKGAFPHGDGMITPTKEAPPGLSIPTQTATDLVSPLLTPIDHRVQIRSYLRFSLPSTGYAYHCLLLPGSSLRDRVKVSTRAGDEWKGVEVIENVQEGKCTEVQFVGAEAGARIEMETVQ